MRSQLHVNSILHLIISDMVSEYQIKKKKEKKKRETIHCHRLQPYLLSIQFVPDFIKNNIDRSSNVYTVQPTTYLRFDRQEVKKKRKKEKNGGKKRKRPHAIIYIEKCHEYIRSPQKHLINKVPRFISNIKEFPLFTSNFHLFHCKFYVYVRICIYIYIQRCSAKRSAEHRGMPFCRCSF